MQLTDDDIHRVGRVREDILLVGYHLPSTVISHETLKHIESLKWPPQDPRQTLGHMRDIGEAVEAIEKASGRELPSVGDHLRARFAEIKATGPETFEDATEAPPMDHGASSVAALADKARNIAISPGGLSTVAVVAATAKDDDLSDPAIVTHIVNEVLQVWRHHSSDLLRSLNEADDDIAKALSVERDPNASIGEVRSSLGAVLESRELVARNIGIAQEDGGAAVSEKFEEITMGVDTPEAKAAAKRITHEIVNMPELVSYNNQLDKLKFETGQWIEHRIRAPEHDQENRMEHSVSSASSVSSISLSM